MAPAAHPRSSTRSPGWGSTSERTASSRSSVHAVRSRYADAIVSMNCSSYSAGARRNAGRRIGPSLTQTAVRERVPGMTTE